MTDVPDQARQADLLHLGRSPVRQPIHRRGARRNAGSELCWIVAPGDLVIEYSSPTDASDTVYYRSNVAEAVVSGPDLTAPGVDKRQC